MRTVTFLSKIEIYLALKAHKKQIILHESYKYLNNLTFRLKQVIFEAQYFKKYVLA